VRTVATAGHVDHGKSSLVLALTGTDPDRFPEEKARGLTIDLGFAFTTLPSGEDVAFVDVPGHVRFIKNMLAGVGAVDVALLVVAASEGWMPQSEEHLRILELLGVRHGMVALTKADTVDTELVELAQLEVEERLAQSSLRDAPVVVCDSVSGRGLDAVRAALDAVLEAAPSAADVGRPRLWVDRVFVARGAGTIVTGTLSGGSIAVDDEMEIPRGARRVRVRAIESAHHHLDRIGPGTRVALNLVGVDHHELVRGDAVVRPGHWTAATVVDVGLTVVPGEELKRRGRLQAYVGSGEHRVWLRSLDDDQRFARLRFDLPLPLAPGDRLVLRDPGRRRTVAGAEVLDVQPSGAAKEAPARLALPLGERLLAGHGWVAVAGLPRLAGMPDDAAFVLADALVREGHAVRVGAWLVAPETRDAVRKHARERVLAHHRSRPLERGLDVGTLAIALRLDPGRLRAALEGADDLTVERGAVRDASHVGSVSDSPEAARLLAALDAAPFAPPSPAEVGADVALVRALVREGVLVDVEGVVFTASALARARALVQQALRERGSLTIADARDVLGSSRKYVVPLMSRLDAEGVTRRRGDERIAGAVTERAQAGDA
jgi:selenocysteine-specific elongation factor